MFEAYTEGEANAENAGPGRLSREERIEGMRQERCGGISPVDECIENLHFKYSCENCDSSAEMLFPGRI